LRILWCGDSPTVDTGFGVVAKNVLQQLHAKGHQIGAMGINMYGDPYDHKEFPFPIWPVDKGSLDLMYGYQKFWYIENTFKPDLIFFLNDPWVIRKYMEHRPATDRYVKLMAYYPTDGGPMKKEWVDMLNEFDAQVVYSNFAERILIEANGGKRPKNMHQIYHGVDTKTFFPIKQDVARQQLGLDPNWFIVGMVARNQYRKRYDLLMKAFAEFAKDKPNAKLYLHTFVKDVGFDIIDMAEQFDMGDKLILTQDIQSPAAGVPASMLNVIYNSFDVNALISLGDGFGLPVAESMATGCPQLVSGHSCLQELVDGHGGLTVKTALWMMNTAGFNTWGGVSDVKDIQDKLQVLYDSQELRIALAKQGYEYIKQPQFNWEHIGESWNTIISDIFHLIHASKSQ
jgi:glycosyltransferase involved in cell wall biosynthesis